MKFKKEVGKEIREAFGYLGESKNYLWAIALIFIAGALVGFAFSESFSFLDSILGELISKISGMGPGELILFILQNNVKSSLYGIAFGVVLGIFPLITTLFNGILIGYVMKAVWLEAGVGEFWRILPHGVFELPAVVISLALGLKLGMFVFSKNAFGELKDRLKKSLIIFLCLVVPLLVVAAIIEGLLIFAYK